MWLLPVRVHSSVVRMYHLIREHTSGGTHWILGGEGKCERVRKASVYGTAKLDSVRVLICRCTLLPVVTRGVVIRHSQAKPELVVASSLVPIARAAALFPAVGICKVV